MEDIKTEIQTLRDRCRSNSAYPADMMNKLLFSFAFAGLTCLPAQSSAQLSTPPHWKWVTDEPARLVTEQAVPDSGWRFVAMPPGWHITTGPRALLFDPAFRGEERFTVESRLILFPDPSDEGYGLFIGGRHLETDSRSFTAFLVRRDGMAAVVRVIGAATEYIVPWKESKGVVPHGGSGTVSNVLRVSAGPSDVVFQVNGDTVAVLDRSALAVDGEFGFRIGARLNMHVMNLDYTRHLALPREP